MRIRVIKYQLILLLTCTISMSAQTYTTREYQIKAVFLYNFTQFVEWPADAFSSENEPLIIGVLGKDPFGSFLEQTVEGEIVNGRPLAVKRYNDINEIDICHILYISRELTNEQRQIILQLSGKSILTVGEDGGFVQYGGIVRFFTRNNRIQFQINPDAARDANLTISSKLLNLAEIVSTKN